MPPHSCDQSCNQCPGMVTNVTVLPEEGVKLRWKAGSFSSKITGTKPLLHRLIRVAASYFLVVSVTSQKR